MADNTWGEGTTTVDASWGPSAGFGATKAVEGGFDSGFDNDASASGGGNAGDRACFNCGEPGHNKADCPKPRVPPGPCRRCNKEGHWSKECPEFADSGPMTCRRCGEEGHITKDCSLPLICKNCGGEGHMLSECKSARNVDRSQYPDLPVDVAWERIATAVKERELDDVKEAVQIYVKATPDTTYVQLEEAFRKQDLKLWLIAIEKPGLATTLTNMDLQGNLDKKYTVTYRFSDKPPRPREREIWPTPDENMERLQDAGEVVERGIPKCRNCDEIGHTSRQCPQDKKDSVGLTIKCYNCDGEGHRVRDCTVPRVDKFGCKNCGKGGHKAADCPEPRSAENVECRKCNEMGHFSRDCPQGGGGGQGCRNCGQEGHFAKDCTEPRNMANVQCRNCDEYGHTGKECPKPRDMSRVKCANCQEMGHFKSRCPNPLQPEDDDAGDFGKMGGGSTNEGSLEAVNGGGVDTWGGGSTANAESAW